MWSRLLRLGLLVALAGCGTDSIATGPGSAYSYAPPQKLPHPGIAEGRPVIEIPERGTWYRCPEIDPAKSTPLIPDQCLSPVADVGVSTIEG